MSKNMLIFGAFLLLAAAQIYVPLQIVFTKQNTLKTGTLFKFKTAPVDPYDAFRGKYIALNFKDNNWQGQGNLPWQHGEQVYAEIENDTTGFARIKNISKTPFTHTGHYLSASIMDIFYADSSHTNVALAFPFDRFYMEETKAKAAEIAYAQANSQSQNNTFALVSIKNGDAVLKNVVIGNNALGQQ